MKKQGRFVSVYLQLIRLLLVSAAISAAMFALLHYGVDYLIDNYIYTGEYEEEQNQKFVQSLQKFVDDNALEIKECAQINRWVKDQKILGIRITQNHRQIFNSYYPDQDYTGEEIEFPEYEWEKTYTIQFSDGSAQVNITGLYNYRLYTIAMILEILLSFALFMCIVVLGIRRKIKYIELLSDQISILENGGLEYEITVKGNDELAMLADGLQKMRISFKSMIEQEADIVKRNKDNITEMSHDLRTPVTAMLLFIEILKKEQFENKEHVKEYIEKIEQRALRMKQLTTNLFRYSLDYDKGIGIENTELSFKNAFFDQVSELCNYLENNNFKVLAEIEWSQQTVLVNADFIGRIFDNIASNIIKYADRNGSVEISSISEAGYEGLRFRNNIFESGEAKAKGLESAAEGSAADQKSFITGAAKIKEINDDSESYGVGVQSISNMMQAMKGLCRINSKARRYCIELLFPAGKEIS